MIEWRLATSKIGVSSWICETLRNWDANGLCSAIWKSTAPGHALSRSIRTGTSGYSSESATDSSSSIPHSFNDPANIRPTDSNPISSPEIRGSADSGIVPRVDWLLAVASGDVSRMRHRSRSDFAQSPISIWSMTEGACPEIPCEFPGSTALPKTPRPWRLVSQFENGAAPAIGLDCL